MPRPDIYLNFLPSSVMRVHAPLCKHSQARATPWQAASRSPPRSLAVRHHLRWRARNAAAAERRERGRSVGGGLRGRVLPSVCRLKVRRVAGRRLPSAVLPPSLHPPTLLNSASSSLFFLIAFHRKKFESGGQRMGGGLIRSLPFLHLRVGGFRQEKKSEKDSACGIKTGLAEQLRLVEHS